ncbi:beta-1,3-galactosyl-O-glycosyl-glycoprotein beta-1,6-N-acetylglucosaminyltransferase [Paragonimus westermani]|uniref:Beta-1,3-galactosyl-O-glycosyl-glycoprotein beta-1,6-N-acetylglucosaminyltransferase n=1 Tax=Paragonimus westermani TaxID=34504 RepID=A0A5J4NHT4_9TREM|nr:beta-1,3-galactosyl-O-glycosyl-glycoprotein beta-1,6-N-acetylglucosaminyltransferase [Paragonimus westermani]
MVFTDLDRAVRLLKAIYRSHNQYCIHVDRKTPKASESYLHQAARLLGSNILFVPPEKRLNVRWGTLSVLQPELLCAQLLMQADAIWKYWINLTGHEFPLKTNWEIVSALRAMNGTNVVEAIYKKRNVKRFPDARSLGFNFTWYKGPVHVIVRREFVDYMLNNPRAKQLYNTLARQAANKIPDETYFATLNHNPDTFPIPGAFLGVHETNWPQSIARFKIWREFKWPCGSKRWRHFICMLGWAELSKLRSSPQLFANKFVPPDAYGMLELWLARKVLYEITYGRHHPSFNLSYYRNHEMSWNHL